MIYYAVAGQTPGQRAVRGAFDSGVLAAGDRVADATDRAAGVLGTLNRREASGKRAGERRTAAAILDADQSRSLSC